MKVVANGVYTANLKQKITYEGGRERATSADDCRRVSVQQYSVRGMTALVYYLINSSLYTGTVQGWWSSPQLV